MSRACLVWVKSFPRQRLGQMPLKFPSLAFGSFQMSITNLPGLSLAEENLKPQPGLEPRSFLMLPSQGSSSNMNQTGPQSLLSSLSWLEEKTCPSPPRGRGPV